MRPRVGWTVAIAVCLVRRIAGQSAFGGTFEVEELASQGYVVVGSDHAGFSDTKPFPDGYDFRPDTLGEPPPAATFKETVYGSLSHLEHDVFPTWLADAKFVLDRVEELDGTPGPSFRRLDLTRIGMFGWSFGGATSVQ